MSHYPIDEEEMARRRDEDFIAALRMIGEGGPSYESSILDEAEPIVEKDLPDVYQ